MPPKQTVSAGTVHLADGGLLPMSTFNSEVLRLLDEALSAPSWMRRPSDKWIKRRIIQDIQSRYGHTCHECLQPIIIHWNGQPCWRELMTGDQYRHGLTTHAFFHTDCWRPYQKLKRNKTRRSRYVRNCEIPRPSPAPPAFPPVFPLHPLAAFHVESHETRRMRRLFGDEDEDAEEEEDAENVHSGIEGWMIDMPAKHT